VSDADAVERVREICLALPEAVEKSFGGHTSPAFRVRDKMFVMISEDRTSMTFKGAAGVQEALVAGDPDRFYVPPYVGAKGWVGARLDVGQDWDEIAELLVDSYRMVAPKRLAARVSLPPSAAPHDPLRAGSDGAPSSGQSQPLSLLLMLDGWALRGRSAFCS
jgi:hypothetical protein